MLYETPFDPCLCPVCRGHLGHAWNMADDRAVGEGDYAICKHCGSFLIIGKGFSFEEVSDERIRTDKRFTPRSIEQLFEAQRAVRARAKLLIVQGPDGPRVVTMVDRDTPATGEN